MPRQNRVTPDGTLIAVPDRGLFWGNRGGLHDPAGRLVRYSRGRAWAICLLEFKGRRRQQRAPGRLTELYFLDEATGRAASAGTGITRPSNTPGPAPSGAMCPR